MRLPRHPLAPLAALALCSSAAAAMTGPPGAGDPPLEAEYRVTVRDPAQDHIDVELVLEGVPNYAGPLMLAMRAGFTLAQLPRPALRGKLRAADGAGEELRVLSPRPYAWLVVRPADGTLRLSWSVPTDLRARPEVVAIGDSYEWPFLAEDHGLLYTATLFPLPVGAELHARVVLDLPEGWEITSSWPSDARGALLPPSRGALANDYIAIGPWSVRGFRGRDFGVRLVVPPGREPWLEVAEELTAALIPAELELFGMSPAPEFLFVLEGPPAESALRDLAGSAKTSSLVLSVPERLTGAELHDELTRVLAHEFFHTWGQARLVPVPELRWLQEGFTDYYAQLVPARLELLTWSDFSLDLARALGAWTRAAESGRFTIESAGETAAYAHDPAARALVYRAGMVLAALCDRRIREARPGASLDDFMRALYNDPRWSATGAGPTPADVEQTLARFVGEQSAAELLALTRSPRAPDLVQLFRAAGADIASERHPRRPEFDAELEGTRISALRAGGEVERFGLQVGDELLSVNGSPCTTGEDVPRLWRSPREGRMQCSLRRGGTPLEFEGPVPQELLFLVDPRPWRSHAATAGEETAGED